MKTINVPFLHVDAFATETAALVDEDGYDRAHIKPVDGKGAGEWERERWQAILDLVDSAPVLLDALLKVQTALANWRDGKDITLHLEGHGPICLEEVKYCVVDAALNHLRGIEEDEDERGAYFAGMDTLLDIATTLATVRAIIVEEAPELEAKVNDRLAVAIVDLVGFDNAEREGLI